MASSTICGAMLLALAAGPAFAQGDTAVEEVVVTGSRIPQPNLTSVSPVQVVGAGEILTGGRTNAADRARFNIGDTVRVKSDFVPGHVRMPAYLRGKSGRVISRSTAFPFPDAEAHGVPSTHEPTYDVLFQTQDLWPGNADPAELVASVFESYLETAPKKS